MDLFQLPLLYNLNLKSEDLKVPGAKYMGHSRLPVTDSGAIAASVRRLMYAELEVNVANCVDGAAPRA